MPAKEAAKRKHGSKNQEPEKNEKPRKSKKTKGQILEDKLVMKKKFIWEKLSNRKKGQIYNLCEDYKRFLDVAKTEREAVREILRIAKKAGFRDISTVKRARAGTKIYMVNRNKTIALGILGGQPVSHGVNMVASHIDSPRLDLKQNPLYEDGETKLGMLRTHYYGGIKKYHWVNIPLAIHGTVIRADGSSVDMVIGEKPGDPVFTIMDLLPHLSRKSQGKKKLNEGIAGEGLQLLFGSLPVRDEKVKSKVKLNLLKMLNQRYGMTEEDFISAELEVVPAWKATDVGLDASFVGAYGHDDRVCAYTSLMAICEYEGSPENTLMALFFDKEEIGSDGNTGVKSRFVENTIGAMLGLQDREYRDAELRAALENSKALSSDVNAAVNPMFKGVHELSNAAKAGCGICITKYTGSGGKYSSSDASAEFVGEIRRILNREKVPWQAAALGKVDEGGGGTVAKFLAELNMDVLDCGTALISMHSPFELASKADIFATYEAYVAFYKHA